MKIGPKKSKRKKVIKMLKVYSAINTKIHYYMTIRHTL